MDGSILGNKSGVSLGGFIVYVMLLILIAAVAFIIYGPVPYDAYYHNSRESSAYYHNSRESGRRSTCMTNLKQLGLASFMYSQDWDDRWMPARGWAGDALYNYVKNDGIFDCPRISGTASMQTDYEYNPNIAGAGMKDFVNDPGTVLCMADGRPKNRDTAVAGMEFSYPHMYYRTFLGIKLEGREEMHCLFCDTHVGRLSRQEAPAKCKYRIK